MSFACPARIRHRQSRSLRSSLVLLPLSPAIFKSAVQGAVHSCLQRLSSSTGFTCPVPIVPRSFASSPPFWRVILDSIGDTRFQKRSLLSGTFQAEWGENRLHVAFYHSRQVHTALPARCRIQKRYWPMSKCLNSSETSGMRAVSASALDS